MSKIKITDIIIEERQRKAMDSPDYVEHIKSLSESIKKFGLLSPVVLDDKNVLIAGFTRIQAHMFLGLETIECVGMGEVSEIQRKEMELAENVERMDLEWWEESAAIAEIHTMKKIDNPDWTMAQTGALVGAATSKVSQSIDLAGALGEDNSPKEEKTLRSALSKRKTDKQLEKRKAVIAHRAREGKVLPAVVKVGDALELIKQEPDESYDAIVTNFPFGVDLTYKGGKRPYFDDEMEIIDLVHGVVQESYRVLKDDSWFVGFFDIRKITHAGPAKSLYQEMVPILAKAKHSGEIDQEYYDYLAFLLTSSLGLTGWLEQAGFTDVNMLPSIWVKPNKTAGLIGDPRKGLVSSYEALVWACKGEAVLLKQGRQNVFIADTPLPSERLHDVQMPVDLCSHIISMVSLGGGRILDPFAGSGSMGLGALDNQCEFVGYEINPEYADNANLRLSEHIYSEGDEDGIGEADE